MVYIVIYRHIQFRIEIRPATGKERSNGQSFASGATVKTLEMRTFSAVLVVAASVMLAAPVQAAVPPEKLVYKIDSIIATVARGRVSIEAKGAVPSGGWKAAKLKLVRAPADPHAIVVDFVAQPPAPGVPVIQGLLPVSAHLVLPMRRGAVTVRAVSDANEMTTQILK